MDGIDDLSDDDDPKPAPLAQAPALRYLRAGSDSLQPDAFTVFMGHPSLEYVDANLGADKRSFQVNQMLDLPRDFNAVYRTDYRIELMNHILAV